MHIKLYMFMFSLIFEWEKKLIYIEIYDGCDGPLSIDIAISIW